MIDKVMFTSETVEYVNTLTGCDVVTRRLKFTHVHISLLSFFLPFKLLDQ